MTEYTFMAPALAQSVRDRRLSLVDRAALQALWQPDQLSPYDYRPMKCESLGQLLGIRREPAARALRRLVAFGYLLRLGNERRPQGFLLVNVRVEKAA